jgi:hypothetical protein
MSRRPLAELPNWDGSAPGTPTPKKTRRSMSKRVSFGGQEIKHYYEEHHHSPENEYPAAVLASVPVSSPRAPRGSPRAPGIKQGNGRPPPLSPRRSPRLARKAISPSTVGDADNENDQSVTLSLQLPTVGSVLPNLVEIDRLDTPISPEIGAPLIQASFKLSTYSKTATIDDDTAKSVRSAPSGGPVTSPALFMDEDVEAGIPASRLSMHGGGGGDDTTLLIPRNIRPNNALVSRTADVPPASEHLISPVHTVAHSPASTDNDPNTCGSDITSRVPRLSELLELDEAYDKSYKNRESIGDITLGIPSLSALAEEDCPDESDGVNLQPVPKEQLIGERPAGRHFSKRLNAVTPDPPVQAVLPETRQLFCDPDEDTVTIHERNTPAVELRGALPLRESNQKQTPTRRVAISEDSLLQQDKCGQPEQQARCVSDLLDIVGVQFRDDWALTRESPQRCSNEGAAQIGENMERDELADKVLDEDFPTRLYNAITAQTVLKILQASARQIKSDIGEKKKCIEDLTSRIERQQPDYLAFPESKTEQAKISSVFKRLRKVSSILATKKHRIMRNEREVSIRAAVCNKILGLEMDRTVLTQSSVSFKAETGKLEKALDASGLSSTVSGPSVQIDSDLLGKLRSKVHDGLRCILYVRKIPQSEARRELRDEIASHFQQKCNLENEVVRLRCLTSSKDSLVQFAAKDRGFHLLLSDISGIKPVSLGSNDIRVLLFNMEVHFKVNHEMVTAVLITAHEVSDDTGFVVQGLRAVHTSCLAKVQSVNDIPLALQLSSVYLSRVISASKGFTKYARLRQAEILRTQATHEHAELTVRGDYHSISKQCIFSVTLSLVAVAPKLGEKMGSPRTLGSMDIRVLAVDAYLGDCPMLETVRRMIDVNHETSTKTLQRRRLRDRFPLSSALEAIWRE